MIAARLAETANASIGYHCCWMGVDIYRKGSLKLDESVLRGGKSCELLERPTSEDTY